MRNTSGGAERHFHVLLRRDLVQITEEEVDGFVPGEDGACDDISAEFRVGPVDTNQIRPDKENLEGALLGERVRCLQIVLVVSVGGKTRSVPIRVGNFLQESRSAGVHLRPRDPTVNVPKSINATDEPKVVNGWMNGFYS